MRPYTTEFNKICGTSYLVEVAKTPKNVKGLNPGVISKVDSLLVEADVVCHKSNVKQLYQSQNSKTHALNITLYMGCHVTFCFII